MFLLDTNVISELRRNRNGTANVGVTRWISTHAASTLYLSAISIFELELGVLLMARRDPDQGRTLRFWFETQVLTAFAGRILSVDAAIAQRCAALNVPDPHAKWDALIAATAFVHGMTVVTRNTADFESTGVRILNPWSSRYLVPTTNH